MNVFSMNRKFGLPSDDLSWSRSKGNIGISASVEGSILSTPMGRFQGRNSKKNEEEEITRKRIRCSRCRKRKIKCSGPIGGEDQPCLNCKNAGTNTSCAFELAGSLKVDLARLQYASQEYPYQISSTISTPAAYGQEQQYFEPGGSLPLFQASSYPGAPRIQRDIACLSYTNPVTNASGRYNYGQPAPNYSQYQTQWSVTQGAGQPTSQDQITQWNSSYDPTCDPYGHQVSRVPQAIPCVTVQLPVSTQSQTPFPAISTLASTLVERTLPRPSQLSSSSPPTIVIPTGLENRGYWLDSQNSQTESISSRHSSQDTSSVASSTSRSEATMDHHNAMNQDLSINMYPHLLNTSAEQSQALPCAVVLKESNAYNHQQPPEEYYYDFTTPKVADLSPPVARPDAIVGNHPYTLLSYRGREIQLGTLQYDIYGDVAKTASRIPVEATGIGSSAERH